MELATKYALMPEDDLSRHVPTKKQMTEFDVAMSKILNSSLPDHEKVQQYYELLKRKMKLQEFNIPWRPKQREEDPQKRKKLEKDETVKQEPIIDQEPIINQEPIIKQEPSIIQKSPTKHEEQYDALVLSSVPKPMKKHAETLLNFLKSRSNTIEWDQSGLVKYKGQTLEQSNLAELFHLIFCVNKKPPIKAPTEFLQVLEEIGVLENMIKNKFLSFQAEKVISPRRNFVKSKKRPTVRLSQLKPNVQRWESFK